MMMGNKCKVLRAMQMITRNVFIVHQNHCDEFSEKEDDNDLTKTALICAIIHNVNV
jgi:hypothetical protein